MDSLVYIPDPKVREILNYDSAYEAVKDSLQSVAQNRAIQNARDITLLPNGNKMYTMPGYLESDKYGSLACKVVTYFHSNTKHNMDTHMATILLMDEHTGAVKAAVAGTEITLWRTAAASAVATKYLHGNKTKKVLAIIGAGSQSKAHALAFQHHFAFKEIRIWNRTLVKGRQLVEELNQRNGHSYKLCDSIENCVKDADVIITATSSDKPLIRYEWLKKGAHINVIGVNGNNFELDQKTYEMSDVYIDSWEGAKRELQNLNIKFKGQIGDLITGTITGPTPEAITVFQSLGMAVEDCAVARMVYDTYKQRE